MAVLDDTIPLELRAQASAITDVYMFELETEFKRLGWWGSGSTQKWLDTALPIVAEAQETIAHLADMMMDIELGILFDDDTVYSPANIPLVTGTSVRNVPPETVYQRPLGDVWKSIGSGKSIPDSVESGAARLKEIFETDQERIIDLVSREKMMQEPRVKGFRRVPSGLSSCALCLIASTQRYRKEHLKPIHVHCKCLVAPYSESPGGLSDKELLERVHAAVQKQFGVSDRSGRAIDYRKIVVTRDHGEIGPVLVRRGQKFTGPNNLQERTL